MLNTTNPRVLIYTFLLSCGHSVCTSFIVTQMQGILTTSLLHSNWFLFQTLITNISLVLTGHTEWMGTSVAGCNCHWYQRHFCSDFRGGLDKADVRWGKIHTTPDITLGWVFYLCVHLGAMHAQGQNLVL